ncbi:hypothetical protein LJK88_11410 [Paenibacillus sp. P26]|nr:hypothetical protein LJK88_11410 [Paenibacillus sp. P26]
MGIGVIITQSILLFNTIKWLGAGFLIFMAYKSLKARPYSAEERAVGSTARLSPSRGVPDRLFHQSAQSEGDFVFPGAFYPDD